MDDLDRGSIVTSHRVEDRPVNLKTPLIPSSDVLWETWRMAVMLTLALIGGVAIGAILTMLVLLD